MASEKPIFTVIIVDKETGEEIQVDVNTCAEAVTCASGKKLQVHLQEIHSHMENGSIHLTPAERAGIETQQGAQAKADAAKNAAVSVASLMFEGLKGAAATFAKNEATTARDAAYRYTDNKTAVLKQHTDNKDNPHGVTAEHVGLGNVPNKKTNDVTPTYEMSSTLQNLASGEKLSVAFGKIAKAIYDFISHIGNKSNPHSVTAKQAGALPTAGGTMTGDLAMDGGYIKLKRGKNYGTEAEIPTDFPDGGLWLKVVE